MLASTWAPVWAKDGPDYRYQQPSRDGIGKLYLGREISQVMGHRGARWLERKTRVNEERPDRVIDAMALAAGAEVADIGAGTGTGYFSVRLARAVPEGQVFAVDIQPEMLALLHKMTEAQAILEMDAVGLAHKRTVSTLPTRHILIFEKPGAS